MRARARRAAGFPVSRMELVGAFVALPNGRLLSYGFPVHPKGGCVWLALIDGAPVRLDGHVVSDNRVGVLIYAADPGTALSNANAAFTRLGL